MKELYLVSIVGICAYVQRGGRPMQMQKFVTEWPGAARIIGECMRVDSERLIIDGEASTPPRPPWLEGLYRHAEGFVPECAPKLDRVELAFCELFKTDAGAVRKAVDTVIQVTRPTIEHSTGSYLVKSADALEQLALLAYGFRCLSGHGQAIQTLGDGGAIGRIRNFRFTVEHVGTEQAGEALKGLVKRMVEQGQRFAPTASDVLDVWAIQQSFASIVASALSLAVHQAMPGISRCDDAGAYLNWIQCKEGQAEGCCKAGATRFDFVSTELLHLEVHGTSSIADKLMGPHQGADVVPEAAAEEPIPVPPDSLGPADFVSFVLGLRCKELLEKTGVIDRGSAPDVRLAPESETEPSSPTLEQQYHWHGSNLYIEQSQLRYPERYVIVLVHALARHTSGAQHDRDPAFVALFCKMLRTLLTLGAQLLPSSEEITRWVVPALAGCGFERKSEAARRRLVIDALTAVPSVDETRCEHHRVAVPLARRMFLADEAEPTPVGTFAEFSSLHRVVRAATSPTEDDRQQLAPEEDAELAMFD